MLCMKAYLVVFSSLSWYKFTCSYFYSAYDRLFLPAPASNYNSYQSFQTNAHCFSTNFFSFSFFFTYVSFTSNPFHPIYPSVDSSVVNLLSFSTKTWLFHSLKLASILSLFDYPYKSCFQLNSKGHICYRILKISAMSSLSCTSVGLFLT